MVTLSNSSVSHMGKLGFRSLLPSRDLVSYKFKTRMQAPFSESFWCAYLLCATHGQVSHLSDPGPFCQTLCRSRTWGPTSWSSPLLLQGRILWPAVKKQVMTGWGRTCVQPFIHPLLQSIRLCWGPTCVLGTSPFLNYEAWQTCT